MFCPPPTQTAQHHYPSNAGALDLTRCPRVTDAGALCVCECLHSLRVLRFYALAHLTSKAFVALHKLTRLEELDVCGCMGVEDGELQPDGRMTVDGTDGQRTDDDGTDRG